MYKDSGIATNVRHTGKKSSKFSASREHNHFEH